MKLLSFKLRTWLVLLLAGAGLAFMVKTSEIHYIGWSSCSIDDAGEYKNLAEVDFRGLLRPFARINFDEPGDWKLILSPYAHREKGIIITDKIAMKALQSLRFSCAEDDRGKAERMLEIMKGDQLIYSTSYYDEDDRFGFFNVVWRTQAILKSDEALYRILLISPIENKK